MHAIVLAGGKGSRLAPYTHKVPKPLVKVGPHPILEVIVRQLRAAGFERVTLCVSHLGTQIRESIGDGTRFGITVDYQWESRPLGTAAPLRGVRDWTTPALVMNGDILTAVDYPALMADHAGAGGLMTIASHHYRIPIRYGVIETEGDLVRGVAEKPRMSVQISSGIQVIDPRVCDQVPVDTPMDMPELVRQLIAAGHHVRAWPFTAPWHDIGTVDSLRAATAAFVADPARYLPAGADADAGIDTGIGSGTGIGTAPWQRPPGDPPAPSGRTPAGKPQMLGRSRPTR